MQKRDPQIQLNPKGALSTWWVQTLPYPVRQRRDSEQEMDRSHAAAQGQGMMEKNQVNSREGFLEEV